jgi:hypothetical protein
LAPKRAAGVLPWPSATWENPPVAIKHLHRSGLPGDFIEEDFVQFSPSYRTRPRKLTPLRGLPPKGRKRGGDRKRRGRETSLEDSCNFTPLWKHL